MNALLPSHGGLPRGLRIAPQPSVFGGQRTTPAVFGGETPAEARGRKQAEAVVHPLANAFVGDLLKRRRLAAAYELLSPSLRSRYALGDW